MKLVATTFVCVKLTNLRRFASPEKSYCKKRPVYAAVGGSTRSLKVRNNFTIFTLSCEGESRKMWCRSCVYLCGLLGAATRAVALGDFVAR